MRSLAAIAVLLVVVACDSTSEPGPSTSTSTTTTTIDDDTCDRVGDDTVRFMEELIDTLDETRCVEFSDPSGWSQELRDLQRAGKDLDLRVDALRCDPIEIQQRAFTEADLVPEGPLSVELLDLLFAPAPTNTVVDTTQPAETTTSTSGTATTETAPPSDG